MEPGKGQVTISTTEYNDLRDFKKMIEQDMVVIWNQSFSSSNYIHALKKEEGISQLLEVIAVRDKRVSELQGQLFALANKTDDHKSVKKKYSFGNIFKNWWE